MDNNTLELDAVAAVEPAAVVAVIGYVTDVQPIPGADRIVLATVDCDLSGVWTGVVPIATRINDTVVVFLQDALLPADPDHPRWGFMRSHKFRVRMARFKGCASECVIIPALPEEINLEAGTDMGEALGVTKFSKPIPAEMAGKIADNFPSFIPKTDEPNFQRVRDRMALMIDSYWIAREKADGTSGTAFMKDGELRVCSRNWELEDSDNLYWNAARKYDLARIPEGLALQFEIVGPNIQGNPLGLTEIEIRVFTLYDFVVGERCEDALLATLCRDLDLPMSPIVASGRGYLMNEELQRLAEITYPTGKPGEGIVVRGSRNEYSFKAINLLYKD